MKYIVAARIDEHGNASGGKAGDQTGKELCVQTLASSGRWYHILRAPSNTKAQVMILQAYAAAANNNIGYDQSQRITLYNQAKKHNWDINKITTPCETDCSALIAVLCNCAGYRVSPNMYTGNERTLLKALGFKDYTYAEKNLQAGDILWRNGHTAIYVGNSVSAPKAAGTPKGSDTPKPSTNGHKTVTATGKAHSFEKTLAGKYKVTSDWLNVRNGGGKNYKVLVAIPKNTVVENYGYYEYVGGSVWLYIKFVYENTEYTAFASEKYLEKI